MRFVVFREPRSGVRASDAGGSAGRGLFLSGLVVGDLTAPSNWRSEKSLDDYLRENGVSGSGLEPRRFLR